MEIEPQNIFSYCENQRNISKKPICFPTEPSLTKMNVLASGPINLHSRFPSFSCAFPSFCLKQKVLAKVRKDHFFLLIITPAWPTQPWYAALLSMSVQHFIILPNLTKLLQDHQGQKHPLEELNQLHLVVWRIQESLGR